jgi:hypothetical protein
MRLVQSFESFDKGANGSTSVRRASIDVRRNEDEVKTAGEDEDDKDEDNDDEDNDDEDSDDNSKDDDDTKILRLGL